MARDPKSNVDLVEFTKLMRGQRLHIGLDIKRSV
jgi:hypothetical protein